MTISNFESDISLKLFTKIVLIFKKKSHVFSFCEQSTVQSRNLHKQKFSFKTNTYLTQRIKIQLKKSEFSSNIISFKIKRLNIRKEKGLDEFLIRYFCVHFLFQSRRLMPYVEYQNVKFFSFYLSLKFHNKIIFLKNLIFHMKI